MNIELDEVAVKDTSDEALELAAGGAQGLDNMPQKYLTLLWNLC
ncbi:MAG: hypothetical protein QE486_09350 [Burkholderiaceae bacterium]|jgi:hypothetical protein|nr:hypothetical protein [Burkholderiaceae bacterium]